VCFIISSTKWESWKYIVYNANENNSANNGYGRIAECRRVGRVDWRINLDKARYNN
jgi:hypothetical protein